MEKKKKDSPVKTPLRTQSFQDPEMNEPRVPPALVSMRLQNSSSPYKTEKRILYREDGGFDTPG